MSGLNNPQATEAALNLLRSGEPFQWYVITLLALVVYVYFREIKNKNWNADRGRPFAVHGALVCRDRQCADPALLGPRPLDGPDRHGLSDPGRGRRGALAHVCPSRASSSR